MNLEHLAARLRLIADNRRPATATERRELQDIARELEQFQRHSDKRLYAMVAAAADGDPGEAGEEAYLRGVESAKAQPGPADI